MWWPLNGDRFGGVDPDATRQLYEPLRPGAKVVTSTFTKGFENCPGLPQDLPRTQHWWLYDIDGPAQEEWLGFLDWQDQTSRAYVSAFGNVPEHHARHHPAYRASPSPSPDSYYSDDEY